MLRLFLREHASFVVFQLLLVGFILLLYWLDGFRNLDTAIYSFVISLLLLASFLGVRFALRYRYYERLLADPPDMEHALQREGRSPETVRTELYLQKLYRLYQYEVQSLYARQNRHLQFMNQWVHQMKTPLSVMHLLLQEPEELDKASIREEVDRLRAGLDTVLMNARLDTFEQDLQIEQVSLKALVGEMATEHKRLFISRRVYPEIDIDERYLVATDRKWLKFMIGQLLTNAVKYTFETNKKIYVSADCFEGTITLSIRDEGIGIPPADLPRVTKAFFTGENGRLSGESTGMGLYLAQEICSRLGHELRIESIQGKGTTVSIVFPYQEQNVGGST